jgi:hypothetical protein
MSTVEETPRRGVDGTPNVTLCTGHSRLLVTLTTRAVQALYDEIRAQSQAIETCELETGGGLFGPPIRGWDEKAHVAIANVAVASHGRGKMELAYGRLEANEAALIRFQDSPPRRLGDWHVHPTCPAGHVGEPSATDMQTWLGELDRIDRGRPATRYLGIIATAGKRGWTSTPYLHGWVVQRDKRNRPICEPATLVVRGRPSAGPTELVVRESGRIVRLQLLGFLVCWLGVDAGRALRQPTRWNSA